VNLEMMLENVDVCNVANVCWQRVQTDGLATGNAHTPNLVEVGGTIYENVSLEECSRCQ